VTEAVFAYVVGNAITSLFAAAFIFVALTVLKLPGAFMLALLAGICDFVPIVGFWVALTPAIVVALTMSAGTAVATTALYALCSVIENYAIAPRVYGDRLKLSRVAVVLGLFVGGAIGGIMGALLALPIVAAYPIVERIWLRDYLGPDVVDDHERLEHDGE
jgi:predicted PurR-regulated permease PerM